MAEGRYIVVGGGLAGLTTVLKLAEAGKQVDLFSVVPVKRSHSVCAQGGINGAVNTKGEGDHPDIHVKDTLKGGDFLAEQPPVKGMCYAAPGIIYLLDRMGVTFNRTPEGLIDFRRFGGTLHHRTAFAGATTGQQLLYALDEQVRRYEVEGLVKKYEYWEYLGNVLDGAGACRGVVAMDLRTLEVKAFPAEAACLSTGGPGVIFGRSTNSVINTGSAAARAYVEGAVYANGEFIQVHPSAIPGDDKLRLMSESLRGEGGRVWVPSDGRPTDPVTGNPMPRKGEPWYFLEERYPKYGNLVPRDVGTREIFQVCREMRMGIGGRDAVYLDMTHIPPEVLTRKLGGVLEIYEKFRGVDPRHVPMEIFPGMHYSMGGLWVDYEADGAANIVPSARNQATTIPGLYATGECEYQYHGANRLGANSLLSCIYAGQIAGPAMALYARNAPAGAGAVKSTLLEEATSYWKERFSGIRGLSGKENPFRLARELGDLMTENCTVVRENAKLRRTLTELDALCERARAVNALDTGKTMNQSLAFVNQLLNMLELAKVVAKGALLRDEFRGSHYKPEFALPRPKTKAPRDDPEFMALWQANTDRWRKTTMARFTEQGPEITYRDVPTPVLAPEPRHYD
ncbi:MAG TPA: succinate dehydrogenase flavoprotein subunit [Anaeromyxobacter sp.]|nr:succinate dehydrogenase flavoprotein subunit [Anaeromyxobacter sp.]